jgi:leucyl-tRNA synthetase
MKRYNPQEIEPKWQQIWEDIQLHKASDTADKPKFYALSFFPYPSGVGLHIGHTRNFTITDVVARYKRMTGHEVLHPMGWDSFGLPAENFAIKTGQAPQVTTKQNTDNFRRQSKRLGLSIDWSREFASTDPEYYKWTQWFFLLLYKRGLAYQKKSAQFWCPKCKTVLANEQVVNGCCWRHEDTPVTKKLLPQWFFKITDYADQLAADLDTIDWPEGIKAMQRNWIGRSVGAEVDFAVVDSTQKIKVFTTRADTLFGASFVVLAPEHSMAGALATPAQAQKVTHYIAESARKSELDRMEQNREKSGVFTGSYVVNPVNGEQIPVWIADYVLTGYGTGAIMAVPAHDERDHEFAKKYDLPIVEVVEPETGTPQQDPEFRQSIVAIVRNPKTNQYLSVNWGKNGGHLFIGGGREKNEDVTECAIREIREETGYQNVKFVAKTGKIYHNYFAHSKNVARRIEAQGLLFELVDEAKRKPHLEADEKGKFTTEWLPSEEIGTKIIDELHATVFALLVKGECYHDEGIMANSGKYTGLSTSAAREKIVADIAKKDAGSEKVNYRMRDWLISRQRYWGAPIPMVHCEKCGIVPVPEDQLPIKLPELSNFEPSGDGRSPLARATDWVNTTCSQCDGPATRETDTMDGFACSSWYFLRFADPRNDQAPFSPELAARWLPVDLYVGGAEHAVMHLLYARMWTKVMRDAGIIAFDEPFKALRNQGMLLAADGQKISKSKGNDIRPEEVMDSGYGADTLRTIIMFLAPYDQTTPWNDKGLAGVFRFLNRVWTITQEFLEGHTAIASVANQSELEAKLVALQHRTTKKVTADLEHLGFNTAIASMMEYVNGLYKIKTELPFGAAPTVWREGLSALAKMLAPFAPHLGEELYEQLGFEGSVHVSAWPIWDEKLVAEDTATIVVQVNGKVRANILMAKDTPEAEVVDAALNDEHVQEFIAGKKPARVIFVPNKLVNFVV